MIHGDSLDTWLLALNSAMIKEIDTIDITDILSKYQELEKDIVWYETMDKQVKINDNLKRQTSLQYKDDEDPWSSAVGKSRGNEKLYNNINPYFKDTIFEELINKYQLTRTRLMWVPPYSCYSMHRDMEYRIHIPLITNVNCYFVFKKGIIEHLPCGGVYLVNTKEEHTFMNCSNYHRLHFMGVI